MILNAVNVAFPWSTFLICIPLKGGLVSLVVIGYPEMLAACSNPLAAVSKLWQFRSSRVIAAWLKASQIS